MASRIKTLLKDTLVFGLGNLGTKLILFLMVPLYTNFLSDAEYGIADLVFTIAQLMSPFLSVVIFDAIIRFGLSEKEKKEDIILVGVIVLGHEPLEYPDLYQTSSELSTAKLIVSRLLENTIVRIPDSVVEEHFRQNNGNLREMLFSLYDVYEEAYSNLRSNV